MGWINDGIMTAMQRHADAPLDVVLVHYGSTIKSEYRNLKAPKAAKPVVVVAGSGAAAASALAASDGDAANGEAETGAGGGKAAAALGPAPASKEAACNGASTSRRQAEVCVPMQSESNSHGHAKSANAVDGAPRQVGGGEAAAQEERCHSAASGDADVGR